ncbi:MAG: IPT/TIG domain-containing protein [Candidatus Doudnabacteria bacterium]|nr:IPT/TIG domain-containing protein [Candidatus Doudnabacteria bacterium]
MIILKKAFVISVCAVILGLPALAQEEIEINATTPDSSRNASPVISDLSPTSGPVGTQITIIGSGFASAAKQLLNFGNLGMGIHAQFVDVNHLRFTVPAEIDTGLLCPSPPCQTSVPVTPGVYNVAVVYSNGRSNSKVFTVTQPIREGLDANREQIHERGEEFKARMEQKKAEFEERIEQKRADLKTRIEQKRAELRGRLQTIRDENKRRIVERIDRQMDALNERMLKHFEAVLNKLEGILSRISDRADRAESNGSDVSSVRSAITEAQDKIAAARSAITNQTGKTYTIEITGEERLKVDVGSARRALHSDLVKVRETVKAAHAATKNAATALAKVKPITSHPEATSAPETEEEE